MPDELHHILQNLLAVVRRALPHVIQIWLGKPELLSVIDLYGAFRQRSGIACKLPQVSLRIIKSWTDAGHLATAIQKLVVEIQGSG